MDLKKNSRYHNQTRSIVHFYYVAFMYVSAKVTITAYESPGTTNIN